MKTHIIVDQLEEKLSQLELIVPEFCSRNSLKSAGLSCMMVIPEVCAALGIFASVVPTPYGGSCKAGDLLSKDLLQIYDFLVAPQDCCGTSSGNDILRFQVPKGHGEDASVELHNEHKKILSQCGAIDIESIDASILASWSREYNDLRRTVRGISGARKSKPHLLTHENLAIVFEASLALPPQIVLPLLKDLLDALHKGDEKAHMNIPAMINGSRDMKWSEVDKIETLGFLIEEDDACKGRRNFDLSVNPDSQYLYYELLDSASYRPYCSCVRNSEERYELLYKMLGNHGIETVIFSQDLCQCREKQSDDLRIRLMRSGIDPLVYSGKQDVLIEYVEHSRVVIADEL